MRFAAVTAAYLLPVFVFFGCATSDAERYKTMQQEVETESGMSRYTEVKNAGTPAFTREVEIFVMATVTPEPVRGGGQEQKENVQAAAGQQGPSLWETGIKSVSVSYLRFGMMTNLDTDVESGSMDLSGWKRNVPVTGGGYEFGLFLQPDPGKNTGTAIAAGGRLGYASDSYDKNSISKNGYKITEQVDSFALYGELLARIYASDYAFFNAGAGYVVYSLETRIRTDLPQYVYEGIRGTRGLGVLNLGLGLETPEFGFVRIFAEANGWLPLSDRIFEYLSGRVSAGMMINL